MLTADQLRAALARAFNLGSTYWRQADSESYAQNRRSDDTGAKFEALVTETVAALGVPASTADGGKAMPSTRLLELPALPHTHIMLLSDLQGGSEPGFNRGHMEQYARAYGLAVWKAAMDHAMAQLAAASVDGCYADAENLLAALPLPEQGGPQ